MESPNAILTSSSFLSSSSLFCSLSFPHSLSPPLYFLNLAKVVASLLVSRSSFQSSHFYIHSRTMASILHLTALLALTTTALAQSEIVWGSVIYTYYGEKTPSLTSGPYNISPLGATQMLQAGSFIRSRNIDPPTNSSSSSQLGVAAPINGISVQAIDNTQLYALSTDDEFISGSAMAFFQGLYPPRGFPIIDEQDILANGTNLGFPLDGYQYPNVETVSELDFNYIW